MTFRSNIPSVKRALHEGLADGVTAAAEQLLASSNRRVPTAEGALLASGAVVTDRDELTAAVTYGTTPETAEYVVPVHERMDVRHDDGQAKFLEAAMGAEQHQLGEVIAERTRRRT